MSRRNSKSCLDLCEKLLKKPDVPWLWEIVESFQFVFKRHEALLDVLAIDRLNKKGTFFKFSDKVVKDLLRRAGEQNGNEFPILNKETVPKEIIDGLQILQAGFDEVMNDQRTKIYYFAVSLEVPEKYLSLWVNPVRYIVTNTEEEAASLSKKSFEDRAKEMRKEKAVDRTVSLSPQSPQMNKQESPIQPEERLPYSTIASVLRGQE